MRKGILQLLLLCSILCGIAGCSRHATKDQEVPLRTDLKEIRRSDTLRVVTMYGSTSYFLFRDEMMGFDYEMAQNLADYLRLNLKVVVAHSEKEMQHLLETQRADIACYNTVESPELKKEFSFVLPQPESYMVLVQSLNAHTLSDVSELEGKVVHVRENSIFHKRLQYLQEETGGLFKIETVADTVTEDDLIQRVAEEKISFAVANYQTAHLYKGIYPTLDCRMALSFGQHNGWLIRNESKALKAQIEKWQHNPSTIELNDELIKKYWIQSPYIALRKVTIPKGSISPYDHLFRKYAQDIAWDWRLLAAIAFHESRFNARQVSWAGAAGLMQLMPRTASTFGLSRKTIFDPEANIEAGVQYIKSLDMAFRKVSNKQERIKFILAAYNSGPAHVLDAIALTRKYGKNASLWNNHVEYFFSKKNEPKYYNDPVVKYGAYSGSRTIKYVKNALATYESYTHKAH